MPNVTVEDGLGSPVKFFHYDGKFYPPFSALGLDLDAVLSHVKDLPCRDEDITIVSYPKAGCNWSWQIGHELLASQDDRSSQTNKGDTMLEFCNEESLTKQPSVRLLNTHLTPDFYPIDLIRKKRRIIFVDRNPKDVFVSYFYHTCKIPIYEYEGEWNGFFELVMAGNAGYENWFDWTKQWEEFLRLHPELPILRLNFEDMKMDLGKAVDEYAKFIGVSCDKTCRDKVVDLCSFSSMKANNKLTPKQQKFMKGGDHPIYRKGIIGDWKSHFTVAQNERFDQEYTRQMKGYNFSFEKYMS